MPDGGHRSWHGYGTAAAWLGADGGLARYRLSLSPFLAFLGLRRDAYIFQDKDTLAIVHELLGGSNLTVPIKMVCLLISWFPSHVAMVNQCRFQRM